MIFAQNYTLGILIKRIKLIIFLLAISLNLFANGSGFKAGLSQPMLHIEHLLAILAMALYAKLNFSDKAWHIIFSFIGMMVIGGLIGIDSQPFSYEEPIILGSVILYGLLVGLDIKIPMIAFIILGGIIGLYHGHTDGVEMPNTTTMMKYVPGFALGALVISAFGEFIGRHMASDSIHVVRFLGGLIVGIGVMKLLI